MKWRSYPWMPILNLMYGDGIFFLKLVDIPSGNSVGQLEIGENGILWLLLVSQEPHTVNFLHKMWNIPISNFEKSRSVQGTGALWLRGINRDFFTSLCVNACSERKQRVPASGTMEENLMKWQFTSTWGVKGNPLGMGRHARTNKS